MDTDQSHPAALFRGSGRILDGWYEFLLAKIIRASAFTS